MSVGAMEVELDVTRCDLYITSASVVFCKLESLRPKRFMAPDNSHILSLWN